MDFNEYQKLAKRTAMYPAEHKVVYPALGLSGEVGELNNKIKKKIRGDMAEYNIEDLVGELGDCLWYLSAISTDLGVTFEEIAAKNIKKLESRMNREVIKGSGDNR